jgi:hypothetical protein
LTELSRDAADDGFHEIQLSGKQLVFLFIVTTTVIVVVFLCGVKVGRGVRAAQGEEPEQVAAATPPATSQPPSQPVTQSAPPPAEAPAPAAEAPPDDLSYHKRLQGDGAPAEKLKPRAEPKGTPPPPAPVPARQAAPPPTDTNVPSAGRPGTWVVQVIATRDRGVATNVVQKLAGKGYPAYLVTPPAGAAQAFYKVHVGRYNDRGEAEQVSTRIKKEEQFQSWITR